MATDTAWLLNLDAELELRKPSAYQPSPVVQARIEQLRQKLVPLLGPTPKLIGQDALTGEEHARAWCPTPHALGRIGEAGLQVPGAPAVGTLREVNSRAFSALLAQPLQGARYVHDMDELRACIAQPCPTGDWWIKGPFGFAGRDRRQALGGVLDPSTEGFAVKTLQALGGLQVEPRVERVADFAVHGWIPEQGSWSIGEPTRQQTDAQGRWQASDLAGDALEGHEHQALLATAERAAAALVRAGYFGPFGIDAYRYLWHDQVRFNPLSEINARFTMGYRWPNGVATGT